MEILLIVLSILVGWLINYFQNKKRNYEEVEKWNRHKAYRKRD